ncbi:MFS transporter, MCP family, solute carrier family 16, member 10 [Exophiala viscosa]|uniref:MFS transporter, MCP family, solute carrier family 16, member 10 n=1 Tax=Exophiala viscosa TaxID=2486360 RepID=A0AAN6IBE4_9EURO|nr:MFS transporter, MCP family, solute carrier family 16, member 10 [Exophiala viscosa]
MSDNDVEKSGQLEQPTPAPPQEPPNPSTLGEEEVSHSRAMSVPSFPEGGTRAWTTVLGCWAVMFFTFGYINAFGVYETYYIATTHETPSTIAWIGSFQFFAMFSAGVVSGPILDRYGPVVVIWPASALFVTSVMLTSVCKMYYQFLLAQGVLGGISCGLVYAPAISIIGHYFHARRALAIGIASSGSSLGGVIFPIMINRLLFSSSLGFGWTVRIVGFLILGLCLLACLTIKPRIAPRKGPHFLPAAFKNLTYSLQVLGLFLVIWGILTPIFFLPSYAQTQGMSRNLAWYTISILNAGSLVGRLSAGFLSAYLGDLNVLTSSSGICGLLIFCWYRIHSNAAIIVFSVLFGMFSGVVVGMFASTLAHTAPHPSQIGTYIGMAVGILGVLGLTGSPISGAMIAHYGGYNEAIGFSGAVTMAGTALLACAQYSKMSK